MLHIRFNSSNSSSKLYSKSSNNRSKFGETLSTTRIMAPTLLCWKPFDATDSKVQPSELKYNRLERPNFRRSSLAAGEETFSSRTKKIHNRKRSSSLATGTLESTPLDHFIHRITSGQWGHVVAPLEVRVKNDCRQSDFSTPGLMLASSCSGFKQLKFSYGSEYSCEDLPLASCAKIHRIQTMVRGPNGSGPPITRLMGSRSTTTTRGLTLISTDLSADEGEVLPLLHDMLDVHDF